MKKIILNLLLLVGVLFTSCSDDGNVSLECGGAKETRRAKMTVLDEYFYLNFETPYYNEGYSNNSMTLIQDGVTGIVTNAVGSPVKNIKYRLNGFIKFSKTNSKGTFKFKRVLEGDTLLVYPSEELVTKIPLCPHTFLTLQLGDHSLLCKCDTMAVTYRYQVAPKTVYSSIIITLRQIQEFSPSNLIELLRGKIPELQIQEMGGTSKASIRGVSSMSLNTEPLFIIGDTQYDSLESANNAISIDNIQEVGVKKDGAEFGMKGANEVILIKTR